MKSAEERLDVRIHQHQWPLSTKPEQFVHTGQFSLCVIYHFFLLFLFFPEHITDLNTVHMDGLSVPAIFAVPKQPPSVSSHGLCCLGSYQLQFLPAHADVVESNGCCRPPKLRLR